jgi:hypothetical protein
MNSIRRHARAWVLAWLVCQVASLSAFVPRDCCAAHRAAPVKAADAPCPMHARQTEQDRCTLRGTCGGPMAALPLVWTSPGVAPATLTLFPDMTVGRRIEAPTLSVVGVRPLPDTPPPRG